MISHEIEVTFTGFSFSGSFFFLKHDCLSLSFKLRKLWNEASALFIVLPASLVSVLPATLVSVLPATLLSVLPAESNQMSVRSVRSLLLILLFTHAVI